MPTKVEFATPLPIKDNRIVLCNGDLIVVTFRRCDNIRTNTYMVSSYIAKGSHGDRNDYGLPKSPAQYCSFVNLQDGGKAFPEPCSRRTTMKRIVRHISNICGSFNDVTEDDVLQIKKNEYSILIVPVIKEDPDAN